MKRLDLFLVITLAILGFSFIRFSVLADSPPTTPSPDESSGFLSGPTAGDPLDIALDYLHQNRESLGLTEEDLADVVVKDRYTSQHNQVTHIYLRQRLAGIEVFNGDISINIDREGRVINLGNRFVPNLSQIANSKSPSLRAITAVNRAVQHLKLTVTQPLVVRQNIGGTNQEVTLSNGGVSQDDIPVKLMYQPVGKSEARLVWNLALRLENNQDWWNMTIDTETGKVLHQNNWIANDVYRIYPLPLENPDDGASILTTNPADPIASPYGWHDTNGATGAEYTDTRGNNVFAQEDIDKDNTGGFRPNGGPTLTFDFSIAPTQPPSEYQPAAITNLFYWNNVLHDIHYRYGFDEAAGNFQENTYGRGGTGGDPVQADAQDGADANNANFSTPPDGFDPRMQMFLFTSTTPNRDSDLDNGIIIHEYGHGVSNRLTGGPSNTNCLGNAQSNGAGEGWSDWWSLALTAKPTDTREGAYTIGTYALGQPPNGPGFRHYRYSTNMTTNPLTYGKLPATNGQAHYVGEIWAVTLWDMYWNLVDDYGFDPDLYSGHGGNNLALQLVMDGLKLQPCSPTFLDARDAILLADMVNNSGANQCRIWEAFAKRGMGVNADDDGSDISLFVTENFELPFQCRDELIITESVNPSTAIVGKTLTYTLVVNNYTSRTLTGVVITDTIPTNTAYVPGSASNGGGENAGVVRWNIGQMTPGDIVTRTFQVIANSPPLLFFFDDMESGSGKWTVSHVGGAEDWILNKVNSHGNSNVWFASDPAGVADKYLITANSILIPENSVLSFWHFYNTEKNSGGGVVEISTDGGAAWTDLGAVMIQNGYNSSISPSSGNPIAGRRAFTGKSGKYLETVVDLSNYSGKNAQIRFRMASDIYISRDGWYVDDVSIQRGVIRNTAYVSAAQGDHNSDTIMTMVVPAPKIAINPTALASTQPANVITTKLLTISNVSGTNLTWTIYEYGEANNANLSIDNAALIVDDCTSDLSWASVSPITGTLPVNASTLVTVTFDSAELGVGSYHGNLCIDTNDPLTPEIVAPLTLDVTKTRLSITKMVTATHTPIQRGDALTYTIVVANRGEFDATGVVVIDILPAYVIGANLNTTATITAGQSITFTLPATLALDAPAGTIINTAFYYHTSGSSRARVAFALLPNKIYLPLVIQNNTR